jgi:hypothetical protein
MATEQVNGPRYPPMLWVKPRVGFGRWRGPTFPYICLYTSYIIRFCLSDRHVEELLVARGVTVTYEALLKWVLSA